MRFGLFPALYLVAICGCDPVPVQYPPGSAQSPYSNPSSNQATAVPQEPEITGSQRWQHAWGKAMEGIAMGGSIGGPYGAGGGLIIGLITGLITADSYYGQINTQIHTEQKKDQQLEAAIEQELARQRGLENQVANASGTAATDVNEQVAAVKNQVQSPAPSTPAAAQSSQANVTLASLPKTATPKPPPSPFKNVEIRDVNGDGVPDLWIYYNPQKPDEIVRQEESSKGDGRVDTWSYFKDGKMVRREVDNKQQGRADTVYFYDNDKLIREERDETGQGSVTYRALYQNGRIAKVEKDSSGTGRPDLWTYYDTSAEGEVVLKEERDLNGDGIPDLWSYYENGRLARRDVNAVALEILAKKDQLPAPSTELSQIKLPGN
jgi:gas vesicle protein